MSVEFTSHAPEVKSAVDAAISRAAEIIGGMAEGYAKGLAPVDTGLLRNSITHALGGGPTSVTSYNDNTKEHTGTYSSSMPEDKPGQTTIYIGTNVQYAPYQELGAPYAHVPAHPFLRPAIENHIADYQNVLQRELSKI